MENGGNIGSRLSSAWSGVEADLKVVKVPVLRLMSQTAPGQLKPCTKVVGETLLGSGLLAFWAW